MRLFGRNDLVLLLGLTIALFVVISEPVARLLDYVRAIEDTSGLRLLPALMILATVFISHQLWKRQELRAETQSAAALARHATRKAFELERLVFFGQSLARALDDEAIRAAAETHLPRLAPGRRAWAVVRRRDGWNPLAIVGDSTAAEREQTANAAFEDSTGRAPADHETFPMVVGGTPMGALAVSGDPPLSEDQRSLLAAAAALLAVSLKNAELFTQIRETSVRDALTGCYNRTHAFEVLDAELKRASRSLLPLSLLMFDLDHFKAINDTHGHQCGDAVLAATGARMRAVLRGSDLKCRYGGEEFLVMLPDTGLEGARRAAENLRRDIERNPVSWNGRSITVTASFGATTVAPGEIDAAAVMARADDALYRAKRDGRNCTREAPAPRIVLPHPRALRSVL